MSKPHEILLEPASSEIGSRAWIVSHEARAFFDAWQKGQLPAQLASTYYAGYYPHEISSEPGPIAVVHLGEMLYRSHYPEYGTSGLCTLIAKLDADPEVGIIIFKGSVWGGDEGSSERVNNALLACKTPTMFYVDFGGLCSGGYWMASACTAGIYASRENDRVGSIGAYLTYLLPGEGSCYKTVEVYSELSPEKNLDEREVAKGNLSPATETANKIVKAFRASVKANRPQIDDATLKGATYMASEAVGLGLIDGICSWEAVLEKAAQLVASPNNTATNFSTNMLGLMRSPALIALLAASADAITDAQLDAVNAELSQNRTHGLLLVKQSDFDAAVAAGNTDTAGQLTAAQTKVTTHEATIAALNARVTELTGEVARLKSTTPGAEPTTVIVKEEKTPETAKLTGREAYYSEVDEELAKLKAGFPQVA